MAKINRGFILSYQANAHLYERFDVKRKIVTALVKKDAYRLKSFTDSTIYFEMLVEEGNILADCKTILITQFKEEKITLQYTLGALYYYSKNGFTFDSTDGDQSLNSRFLKIVEEVRVELKKPEKIN